jgi:hypothetical protein
MNRKSEILHNLAIAILAIWLGLSIFTDFVVIRTVFEVINDFFKSGDLGIALFGTLNRFEIIFASFLFIEVILNPDKSKLINFSILILVLSLVTISLFYFSYLTPKIATLTEIWKESEKLGVNSLRGITDIQAEHQFYHRLYIGLDFLKMMVLAVLLGFKIRGRRI